MWRRAFVSRLELTTGVRCAVSSATIDDAVTNVSGTACFADFPAAPAYSPPLDIGNARAAAAEEESGLWARTARVAFLLTTGRGADRPVFAFGHRHGRCRLRSATAAVQRVVHAGDELCDTDHPLSVLERGASGFRLSAEGNVDAQDQLVDHHDAVPVAVADADAFGGDFRL